MNINQFFDEEQTTMAFVYTQANGKSGSLHFQVGATIEDKPSFKVFQCNYDGMLHLDLGDYCHACRVSDQQRWIYTDGMPIQVIPTLRNLLGCRRLEICNVHSNKYNFICVTPEVAEGGLSYARSACALWEYLFGSGDDTSEYVKKNAGSIILFCTTEIDIILMKNHLIILDSASSCRYYIVELMKVLALRLEIDSSGDLVKTAICIQDLDK